MSNLHHIAFKMKIHTYFYCIIKTPHYYKNTRIQPSGDTHNLKGPNQLTNKIKYDKLKINHHT